MEQLLLDELKALRKELTSLHEDLTQARIDIAGLKFRSGVVSTISGLLGGGGSIGVMEILRSMGK